MLKALELENFKAFGERARVELAPITLILGENSAGKSSILHALQLLKQSRQYRDQGNLLLPRVQGGTVDLGSFQDMLFDHDLRRVLTIGAEFTAVPERTLRTCDGDKPTTNLDELRAIEVAFHRPDETGDIRLKHLALMHRGSRRAVVRFEPVERAHVDGPMVQVPNADGRMRTWSNPLHGRRDLARCVWTSDDLDVWPLGEDVLASFRAAIQKLRKDPTTRSTGPTPYPRDWGFPAPKEGEKASAYQERLKEFDHEVRPFLKKMAMDAGVPNEYLIGIFRRAAEETYVALDGFVPSSIPRHHHYPEIDSWEHRISQNLLYHARNWGYLDLDRRLCELFEAFVGSLGQLFSLGPFRQPPERWYMFSGTSPANVGNRGDLLPALLFRRPEMVSLANEWLQRLEIGYKLTVHPLGERYRDMFEVRLVDLRRSQPTEVGLSDVGFGISQLLPFIVQSLADEKRIISIEQPEVHVHPRLQADLGDLLAETIRPPQGHQFLIETHSEHLVLRMQRLVRERKLTPDDVSVLYVRRGPAGSQVQRLRLDEGGDFIDEWPNGFFPERLRELR